MLSAQSPHSGDWLHAAPISTIGLRMSDEEIRVAVGLRIGTKLCEPHPCKCGSTIDARGLHALSCKKVPGKHQRHNMINDVLWRSLNRASVPSMKEPSGLSRSDGKRPDGVTVIPWSRGRCLIWDVTVPDTFSQSYVTRTAQKAGGAADQAVARKLDKYLDLSRTHIFVAVAVESSGCWSSESLNFISDLGRRLVSCVGDPMESTFLFQRLSVALQRGNAILVHGGCSF